jgi:hypothetical protein
LALHVNDDDPTALLAQLRVLVPEFINDAAPSAPSIVPVRVPPASNVVPLVPKARA